ncbi:ferredoxin [Embleya sp. NBC_00888]|uniref:ferredoxin n=1 Tax=Embleya sp. NBC_00888 TaxID=2975960 RepID=UPI00386BFA01|nr:ferredoxin [Embleya sp. NBC_00888]
MRVRVNSDACMGHSMCSALASEVYEVTDEGFNEMGDFEVDPARRAAALRGARACPEKAITIAEEPTV